MGVEMIRDDEGLGEVVIVVVDDAIGDDVGEDNDAMIVGAIDEGVAKVESEIDVRVAETNAGVVDNTGTDSRDLVSIAVPMRAVASDVSPPYIQSGPSGIEGP